MVRVLVNGAFDVLHSGHIELINYAKSLGDHLTVAVDSDNRIRYSKGSERPFNSLETRKLILKNLRAVDEVLDFGSNIELMTIIDSCDIRVIGSDWKGKEIVGEDLCEIKFFDRVNDESTTKTLEDYINRRKLL